MREIKKREEADPKDCWKMEDMFPSDEAWEASFLKLKEEAEDFRSRKGTFAAGPREFYQALQKQDEIQLMIERVVVYASQRYHQDMGNRRYQEMAGRAQTAAAQAADALSFVSPEILEMGEEKIETFMKQLPELEHYRRMLEEELRVREHVLSPELETVMAKTQEMADGPQQIFMAFNNADAKFGTVTDADGKEVPLTAGSYGVLMESKDRSVRKEAFRKLYRVYEDHKNMLSATFSANLKQAQFYAGMRHYGSALEAALDGGNIPVSVYDNLIAAVHEKLPAMYQYMELRKKLLHLEDLHLYDVYVPLVERPEKEIPFEEAKKIVKEGLSVLGEDYARLLEEGFDNGWIDVYENQ